MNACMGHMFNPLKDIHEDSKLRRSLTFKSTSFWFLVVPQNKILVFLLFALLLNTLGVESALTRKKVVIKEGFLFLF